jgi:hypothetical protein
MNEEDRKNQKLSKIHSPILKKQSTRLSLIARLINALHRPSYGRVRSGKGVTLVAYYSHESKSVKLFLIGK